jgi:thiol-disulfide isomerase/thioredoxin
MTTNTLSISSKLPSFNLKGIDGNFYSPDSFPSATALIVIFSCNHCPYVQAYEGRMIEIQKKYGEKGIQVIAINSNDDVSYPDDSFENMKLRAREQNFNFLYLRDDDQSIAKLFDATHTPEIFLFNKNNELVYHGKIDDNWQEPQKVVNHYLEDALNELLENKGISVPETYSIGCTIKWKR